MLPPLSYTIQEDKYSPLLRRISHESPPVVRHVQRRPKPVVSTGSQEKANKFNAKQASLTDSQRCINATRIYLVLNWQCDFPPAASDSRVAQYSDTAIVWEYWVLRQVAWQGSCLDGPLAQWV